MNHPLGLECSSGGAPGQAETGTSISHGVSISVCCSVRTVGSWIAGILGTIFFFIVEFKIDKAQL